MKRPLPIYFVVVWCLLVLGIQLGHVIRFVESTFPEREWLRGLPGSIGLLFIVCAWHVFRLLHLRPFSIRLSIAVLAWSTLNLAWTTWNIMPTVPNPLRVIIGIMIWAMLNIISIWYLGRRSFREYAAQFSAERESKKGSSR